MRLSLFKIQFKVVKRKGGAVSALNQMLSWKAVLSAFHRID